MPRVFMALLQKAGEKLSVGYQTMIRMICTEQIREYLKKDTDLQE